ncbi:DUF6406 domain-containing protein [Streptomyces durhamensis]|uniref:DUF6406 domain-containing protein n=1 Tax=Streptomyces durhamensis TaxID=68194 RepID=UPI0004CCB833|nr:DUF6406 domain-containing protein [Streptomyces durhamensis]
MTRPGAEEVTLRPSEQLRWGIAKFSVMQVNRRPGQFPTVRLYVSSGGAGAHHDLVPGDVFPVQGQEWKLDRIEDLDSPSGRWTVVLARAK